MIKVTDINPENEESVLKLEEIVQFLEKEFGGKKEQINYFLEDITNYRDKSIYHEFSLDKEHNLISIILNTETPIVLFKDLKKNKIYPNYLTDIDEIVLDQNKGAYYVKSNALERRSFLMYYDIEKNNEFCIYEEKDPNFQLFGKE